MEKSIRFPTLILRSLVGDWHNFGRGFHETICCRTHQITWRSFAQASRLKVASRRATNEVIREIGVHSRLASPPVRNHSSFVSSPPASLPSSPNWLLEIPLCPIMTQRPTSSSMGPAAFMWPADRPWAADYDNVPPCDSSAGVGERTPFPLSERCVIAR